MRDWFERNKILGRVLVVWAVLLITAVVLRYLYKMGEIGAPDATVISVGVIGILGTAIAFLKWQKDRVD